MLTLALSCHVMLMRALSPHAHTGSIVLAWVLSRHVHAHTISITSHSCRPYRLTFTWALPRHEGVSFITLRSRGPYHLTCTLTQASSRHVHAHADFITSHLYSCRLYYVPFVQYCCVTPDLRFHGQSYGRLSHSRSRCLLQPIQSLQMGNDNNPRMLTGPEKRNPGVYIKLLPKGPGRRVLSMVP